MLEFETRTSAVVSTAHISRLDYDLLVKAVNDDATLESIIRLSPTGIEIMAATEEQRDQIERLAGNTDLTNEFLANLGSILDTDETLYSVIFDRDGYAVGGLTEFDWS